MSGYQLIDFGEGEKLECFAGRMLRRPSPAAIHDRRQVAERWEDAESVFDLEQKRWIHDTQWPSPLLVDCGGFRMPIAPTPFGHVGLFPEQLANWQWLTQHDWTECASHSNGPKESGGEECAVQGGSESLSEATGMNLFGYSGASTIAMASSGMQVAHVDAAKANVNACRTAAAVNGLEDHPIRYLVDDAPKFAAREVRRGKTYHTIVLDPPAYGHAPGGKAWRLERDLWPLLANCLNLLERDAFRLLVTGHSPQVGVADVMDYLHSAAPAILGVSKRRLDACSETGRLVLYDEASRGLDAGFFVRVDGQG